MIRIVMIIIMKIYTYTKYDHMHNMFIHVCICIYIYATPLGSTFSMLYQRHASPKSMHTSIKYAMTLVMLSFVSRCWQLALQCAIVFVC